jgi:hypothetical protein
MDFTKIVKNASLATLIIGTSSLIPYQDALAGTRTRTYQEVHTFGGVHRCSSRQQQLKEADKAGQDKVRELKHRFEGDYDVRLNRVDIVKVATRNWEEKDRFGFSRGRKCETTMELNVVVDMKLSDW